MFNLFIINMEKVGPIGNPKDLQLESLNAEFKLPDKYEIIKKIGKGAYGKVISALDKKNNLIVAIKKIPDILWNLYNAKRVVSELKILDFLYHENIILLLDVIVQNKVKFDVYIVTEKMDLNLAQLIFSNHELSAYHVKYISYQILRGLYFMHSADIIHRDLKPNNILINENCDTKIADFGFARDFSSNIEMTREVQARSYRAPELIFDFKKYDTSIDMWSFGCILAEMLTRKLLFASALPADQIIKIIEVLGYPKEEIDFIQDASIKEKISKYKDIKTINFKEKFTGSDPEAIDLLSKLLVFDPKKRFSAEQCLKHPYYKNLHDECGEPVSEKKYEWSWDKHEATYDKARREILLLSKKKKRQNLSKTIKENESK